MKAIIIDDEKRARVLLKAMLADFCPEVNVMGDFTDLESGVQAIKKNHPDLVFLDIELPESSGLQILDYFSSDEVGFSIIFVTAYNEYAIQAFKLSAIDYLLKPINAEKLKEAIQHYKQLKIKNSKQLEILKSNLYDARKKIVIPSRNDIQYIEPNEILFLKADGSYCQFVLKNGKKIMMSKNLKFVEEMISDFHFLQRVHKSYIVNVNEVKSFLRLENKLILSNNEQIDATLERLEAIGMR
jgi:two-component system LytT family response regulator